MHKHEREALAAVLDECERWDLAVEVTGKTPYIAFRITKGARFVGWIKLECSPRDRDNAVHHAVIRARRFGRNA